MSGPFGSSPWGYNPGGDFYSYTIDQSLRFNDDDSPYLTRTNSGAASSTTLAVISFWIKRCNTGSSAGDTLWASYSSSASRVSGYISFTTSDQIKVYLDKGAGSNELTTTTTGVFRDVSSWYHVVVVYNTADSTTANKSKIYVNGVQQAVSTSVTGSAVTTHELFADGFTNYIGNYFTGSYYFDGYLAEFHAVDGVSGIDHNDFGETKDGIWIPKAYSGSYGNNGFYLTFQGTGTATTSQGTTAQTNIGDDQSGTGNNFAVSGLASSDVVLDRPTNNFATYNPLIIYYNLSYPAVFSEANLKLYRADNNWVTSLSTIGVSSGKWYAEFVCTVGGNYIAMGILDVGAGNAVSSGFFIGEELNSVSYYGGNGYKYVSQAAGGSTTSYGATFGLGDIIGVALDLDAGTVKFYKNNTVQNSGTAAATSLSGTFAFGAAVYGNNAIVANFGQDSTFAGAGTKQNNADDNGQGDFYYAPPSGHLAVCSANLPEPEIIDGTDYFNTVTYTGNSSQLNVTGVGFSPNWTWIKKRTTANHVAQDSVRGSFRYVVPNNTDAENTTSGNDWFRSFDSDGFTVSATTTGGSATSEWNDNGATYASWNWKAGGTAVSNTDGSITSQVSANTDAGFSIVTHTGTGSTATVGHGLGVKPDLIIHKNRDTAHNWKVYHSALGATKALELDQTTAAVTTSAPFNNTEPTSTVMTVNNNQNNESGDSIVSYVFASTDGYLKAGSYTGNGDNDGAFVYTGFRPAWTMIKRAVGGTDNWVIDDAVRSPFNEMNNTLYANLTNEEYTAGLYGIDFLSNGFKIRDNDGNYNASGNTYIYLAFAENPFKYANAR